MRWAIVAGVSLSTAACSLFVSLGDLDNGPADARPDAVKTEAMPGRPDRTVSSDATGTSRDTGRDAHDAGVDHSIQDGGIDQYIHHDTGVRDDVHDTGVDHGIDRWVPPYVAAVLDAGPYAYWRFEETEGGIAYDHMDGGHNGTLLGGIVQGSPGVVGNAVHLSGGNGVCIPVSNGQDFQFPQPASFSVELWLKAENFNKYAFLVTTEEQVFPGRVGWTLGVGNPPYPQFEGWNINAVPDGGYIWGALTQFPGAAGMFDGGAVTANVWTYIVATYTNVGASPKPVIWVNGMDHAIGAPPYAGLAAGGSLSFGCLDLMTTGVDNSSNFAGSIDELAIYEHVLPSGQIVSHYMLGLQSLAP